MNVFGLKLIRSDFFILTVNSIPPIKDLHSFKFSSKFHLGTTDHPYIPINFVSSGMGRYKGKMKYAYLIRRQ